MDARGVESSSSLGGEPEPEPEPESESESEPGEGIESPTGGGTGSEGGRVGGGGRGSSVGGRAEDSVSRGGGVAVGSMTGHSQQLWRRRGRRHAAGAAG